MALFSNRVRIGDLLVQKGYITDDQLSTALEEQRQRKMRLGEVLIQLGYVWKNSLLPYIVTSQVFRRLI